jgi:hypothetical protein
MGEGWTTVEFVTNARENDKRSHFSGDRSVYRGAASHGPSAIRFSINISHPQWNHCGKALAQALAAS